MRTSSKSYVVIPLFTVLLACGDERGGADSNDDGLGVEAETVANADETLDDDGGEAPKLDVVGDADAGENVGDCGGGGGQGEDVAFSIIWIANTTEGTVSKVDTESAVELARYRTGPGASDPSRTSVNLFGDVAIANRSGSVVKIAAKLENCVDANQDGVITTSQGADDVLDWGADECVLWYHDVGFAGGGGDNQGGPRAIAWDAGEPGADGCPANPKLWVGWRNQPEKAVKIRRLDGETGQQLGEVDVLDWQQNWGHGTYGGATDKHRNFWALGTLGTLVHVDAKTLAVTRYDNPEPGRVVYGIALDQLGDPWLAGWDGSLWRFEVATQTWEDRGQVGEPGRLRGLAIDQDGHAWIAGNDPCGLIRYDTVAGQPVSTQIDLPGCAEPVGVSVDANAFVWVVDRGAEVAYKIDPETHEVAAIVEGLVQPYTYSDMTGAGLDLVVNPPVG